MSFRILGLDRAPFQQLFALTDAALAAQGVLRYRAEEHPGMPDRIELRELGPGESALLVNFTHQPANTPYHASHAIFVGEQSLAPYQGTNDVPEILRSRLISLRAFDASHMMVDADVIDGQVLETGICKFLGNSNVAYLHAHFARRGCYAARIERG